MQIGTNISSLTAQRSLGESSRDMSVAMERLATGSKINSASDDAAGLAMSERLAGQISGLDMAAKNIIDGQALTSAIEGGLEEVGDILQRMRGLAVQSSSDTTTNSDRTNLNNEMTALKNELTALSSRVKFNGANVLDGSYTAKNIQVGANANETVAITQSSVAAASIGAFTLNGDGVTIGQGSTAAEAITNAGTGTGFTITGNGTTTGTLGDATTDSAKSVAAEINALTASTGVSATAITRAQVTFATAVAIEINGQAISSAVGSNATIIAAINEYTATTGVTAIDGGSTNVIELQDADGDNIDLLNTGTGLHEMKYYDAATNAFTGVKTFTATTGTQDEAYIAGHITLSSATTFSISADASFAGANSVANSYISTATLDTQSNATSAISVIDGAISRVATMRADLGAVNNRLEHAYDSAVMMRDSTAEARSALVDADMAEESAALARAQVLQQVGTAMLAQANAQPQLVLQLVQ